MAREALVIGGGAREHALVHGLRPYCDRVWAAPGNGGISLEAPLVDARKPEDIIRFFGERRPLVVIGPEAPLADGWADMLRLAGFPVAGPSKEAARLESSKRFAKEVMAASGIPTPAARCAHNENELLSWIQAEQRWPKVIKQSGLAQGKGVSIAGGPEEARTVVESLTGRAAVWHEGVLFEDYLQGFELSVQVVTNGREYQWLPVAQDYKRLTPDPKSPNTGGMGAVAPVLVEPALAQAINQRIFDPLMQYLQRHDLDYRGVLYAGLMISQQGPMVLEFNVRLGDPEAEAIIPIVDVNWYQFWWDLSQGMVPEVPVSGRSAVAVVMVADGYPVSPRTGMPIQLGERIESTVIFHAGTVRRGDQFESGGGRVLAVVGIADTTGEARRKAYHRVSTIVFPHSYYRPDIGQ
ncbi:MAG: phosphoribosylamine--glycine ligase [Thermaerobacter sp.]|nr:phosphoribosylamine--glycine ligase [Thermaerobacter sp.]